MTTMADNRLRVGIVMDPIESITTYKDSSFAMLLEAQRRNAEIHYFLQSDLKLLSGQAIGTSRQLTVTDDGSPSFGDTITVSVTVTEVNAAPTVTNPGGQFVAPASDDAA